MKTSTVLLAVLVAGGSVDGVQAGECQVIKACEGTRCIDVPGQFVQIFKDPPGDIGETIFKHGYAYFFASYKDVVPAIKAGKVSKDIRYVVWPDETGRGGQWLDASVYAVKWLTWDSDKPSLSPVTSLMSCSSGNS